MKYRKLGGSDLLVSEVSLGSWLTYGGGVSRERAEACVQRAFDVGINFIDTANVYSGGAAESFLGEVLSGRPRESYVLATKVFFPMPSGDRGLSAAQIEKQLEASLRRLRTDHVDLYQCHRFDPHTPLEETMAALTRAVRGGKTRYIGFSEWNPGQIRNALALTGERFVSSQPQYSLLWREPEAEVFPLCAREGIGQIVWSPLAQGILKHVLGSQQPVVAKGLAQGTGLKSSQIRQLLRIVAPLLLGMLGQQQQQQGLDTSGLSALLGNQQQMAQETNPDMMGVLNSLWIRIAMVRPWTKSWAWWASCLGGDNLCEACILDWDHGAGRSHRRLCHRETDGMAGYRHRHGHRCRDRCGRLREADR